jgi:hypothetical protein
MVGNGRSPRALLYGSHNDIASSAATTNRSSLTAAIDGYSAREQKS